MVQPRACAGRRRRPGRRTRRLRRLRFGPDEALTGNPPVRRIWTTWADGPTGIVAAFHATPMPLIPQQATGVEAALPGTRRRSGSPFQRCTPSPPVGPTRAPNRPAHPACRSAARRDVDAGFLNAHCARSSSVRISTTVTGRCASSHWRKVSVSISVVIRSSNGVSPSAPSFRGSRARRAPGLPNSCLRQHQRDDQLPSLCRCPACNTRRSLTPVLRTVVHEPM